MNSSVKTIEDQHKDHEKVIAANDGKGYFDIIAAREKEDPGVHDREYLTALKLGNLDTDNFMSKVLNHTHPEHAAALSAYKDKYGSNSSNALADFNAKAVKLMGAKRNEKRNTAYEGKVFSRYQVSTPEDQGFLNKYKAYMQSKWKAKGYSGDEDYTSQFWDAHPMPKLTGAPIPVPEHR